MRNTKKSTYVQTSVDAFYFVLWDVKSFIVFSHISWILNDTSLVSTQTQVWEEDS